MISENQFIELNGNVMMDTSPFFAGMTLFCRQFKISATPANLLPTLPFYGFHASIVVILTAYIILYQAQQSSSQALLHVFHPPEMVWVAVTKRAAPGNLFIYLLSLYPAFLPSGQLKWLTLLSSPLLYPHGNLVRWVRLST